MAVGSGDASAIYELLYNPAYTPQASPDAHIEKLTVEGKPAFVLMKESESAYYDVDETTNTIWNLLDGRKTIREIFDAAKSTHDTLTEKEVREVLVSLAEEGTIKSTEQEIHKKRVEIASAFQIDVHLLEDSSKSLAGLFRVTRKLIKKQELPIGLGIAALGFALFYTSFVQIFADTSILDVGGSALIGLLFYQMVVLLPVYAVHELAHAAVCDYYGAKPRDIGTGLYYLAPFFYCDTSDSWKLSRRARIMICVAGPLSTVVISAALVFSSYLVPPGYFQTVLKIAAFFGYYGTLINFSPVIETDGYYILSDILNIPNLRDEAFSYAKRLFLILLGRHPPTVRQSARRKRIIMLYSVVTFAWLAFFGYSTFWLMLLYGQNAFTALSSIWLTLIRVQALNLTTMGVDVAILLYFALMVAGFVVMATVASRNIRMKGVKLETIHDKRVSAFLPLPSTFRRTRGSELVDKGKKAARKFSRSFSVTLEPPLCVAALKLGRVNQSLDAMRGEMQRVEQSFRSLHHEFLSRHPISEEASVGKRSMTDNLIELARQFPEPERRGAVSAVSQFLRRQDDAIGNLLQSAFGTVWTLELSPSDYKRIRREAFPSLIAEDLGGANLGGELEDFKRHVVLGPEAIAQHSSEYDEESKEVSKSPEVYQVTVFVEPMKSRLVFVGRTDKVEGSVVWLGGLFLYQAWTGYIGGVLEDAALGLRSIGLAPSISLTKAQALKLREDELEELKLDFERIEKLTKTVEEGMTKVESTYESATNFHETLGSLVSDESYDVGLYRPILSTNGKHLEGVRERVKDFQAEFAKVSKKLAASKEVIDGEYSRRASGATSPRRQGLRKLVAGFIPKWIRAGPVRRTPLHDAQVKLMFATSRLVYGVVVASDVIL